MSEKKKALVKNEPVQSSCDDEAAVAPAPVLKREWIYGGSTSNADTEAAPPARHKSESRV